MDVKKVRQDFPIFKQKVHGKLLIYLDNAATSQRPLQVIQAMNEYYLMYNANVHRGIYSLSEKATKEYEEVREKVAEFINAKSPEEIIFVKNTTEGINLVAHSWGRSNVKKGEKILITEMEHHSNFVPWQILAEEKEACLDFIKMDDEGLLMTECLERMDEETRIVSITHASNVLGTINSVREITRLAHKVGAIVLVDAAQSVPHMPVDVQEIDSDFLAFSGHKMLGPTGIGVLYGKKGLLDGIEPFMSGGDMISEVHFGDNAKWNETPWKFEAGTPNIAGTIGLGAAIDYLNGIGMKDIREHEKDLTGYALKEMVKIEGAEVYGPKDSELRAGVVAFNLRGIDPHDLASILDSEGIAIRAGHHCAQPLMDRLGLRTTARASFYIYNTKEEVDALTNVLKRVRRR
ncbi:MAG: cysteine desulfurase [Nitrososphaerales archaeon]|nr:cysteine desulfurase [Nitrososphaerales archaeon]